MLGGFIHQNLKWTEYIRDNKESLIKILSKRLFAYIFCLCKNHDKISDHEIIIVSIDKNVNQMRKRGKTAFSRKERQTGQTRQEATSSGISASLSCLNIHFIIQTS